MTFNNTENTEIEGNVLIIQYGYNSVVSNTVLAGIITESLNYECIEEVYGCRNGIDGILREEFVNLAEQSQKTIKNLQTTPCAFLHSTVENTSGKIDFDTLKSVFEKYNIRYLFAIGGHDAQSDAYNISKYLQSVNYEIRVITVPVAPENDIVLTDHCLGYGSAAKNIASNVQNLAKYGESIGNHNLVLIMEIADSHSGWLTASADIVNYAKENEFVPYYIVLPTQSIAVGEISSTILEMLKRNKYCVIVVPSKLQDESGNPLYSKQISASENLKNLLQEEIDIDIEVINPGVLQNISSRVISKFDQEEAYKSGTEAVDFALEGKSEQMLTILRSDKAQLKTEFSTVNLSEVVNKRKIFNENWIEDNGRISNNFRKYLSPLIQGEVVGTYTDGLQIFANDHK